MISGAAIAVGYRRPLRLQIKPERGSIRKLKAAPGGRWDGGHVAAGDPDGFGTGEEFVRRPLDGTPGAKIKFKLGGTLQIFNPNLWRVR